MNSLFSKIILLVATISLFASCDKDTNDLGSDIIGKDNFEFNLFDGSSVIAYNHKTGAVQTNNLNTIQFGVYEDPFFGTTTASFVTQILFKTDTNGLVALNVPEQSSNTTVTFTNIEVTLEIPYISSEIKNESSVLTGYNINPVFGNNLNEIKLSVYRNGIELENVQQGGIPFDYFSDKDFDSFKIGNRLNDNNDLSENEKFIFKNDGTTTIPAMRLKLNEKIGRDILEAPSDVRYSNSNFTRFFKGLYFKVEQIAGNQGCLSNIDLTKGIITIKYKYFKTIDGVVLPTIDGNEITLNTNGNRVNLLKNNSSTSYTTAISTPNKIIGDNNLFLKGGDGSIAVIELFKNEDKHGLNGLGGPNGINDFIDLKNSGWIINEANLVFNIDRNILDNQPEADRILLYDIDNKREIIDYIYDNTTATTTTLAKNVYGGFALKNTAGKNEKYKIRLTNHIRNLINKDSTNVKLGLCVTQAITNPFYGKTSDNSFFIPQGSIMNPLGVVLYGSKPNIDVSKRLKLEIYYTKPN